MTDNAGEHARRTICQRMNVSFDSAKSFLNLKKEYGLSKAFLYRIFCQGNASVTHLSPEQSMTSVTHLSPEQSMTSVTHLSPEQSMTSVTQLSPEQAMAEGDYHSKQCPEDMHRSASV